MQPMELPTQNGHPQPQPGTTKARNQAPPERELLSESGDLWRGGRDSNPDEEDES